MPLQGPILLPRRVAYHSRGIKIYSRCRVQIRPRRGGGPRQNLTLRPRVQRPHSSSGPQTTAENLWGSLPRGHTKPSTQEPEPQVPVPDGVHPWREKPHQRRPLTPPRSPPRLHLPDDISNPNHDCPANHDSTVSSISVEDNLQLALCSAISSIPISWEQLQVATSSDPSLQDLMFCIEPTDRPSLPASIQSYFRDLIVDDVICMGERIVIPLLHAWKPSTQPTRESVE